MLSVQFIVHYALMVYTHQFVKGDSLFVCNNDYFTVALWVRKPLSMVIKGHCCIEGKRSNTCERYK